MWGIRKGGEQQWQGAEEPRALRNYLERNKSDLGPPGRGRKLNKASDRPKHSRGTDTHRGWEPEWQTVVQYAPSSGPWRSSED